MRTILIIEDEAPLQRLYWLILSQFNYKVILAGSGTEGIQTAVKEAPDLIVLDLLLPDMPGLDVARQLQLQNILPSTPLIITTGLGQRDAKDIAQSLEASAVLVKPFNVMALVEAIREALKVSNPK